MHGFGAGVIRGGALGLFGLGLASLVSPLPGPLTDPDVTSITVPAGSEFALSAPLARRGLPEPVAAPHMTDNSPPVPAGPVALAPAPRADRAPVLHTDPTASPSIGPTPPDTDAPHSQP